MLIRDIRPLQDIVPKKAKTSLKRISLVLFVIFFIFQSLFLLFSRVNAQYWTLGGFDYRRLINITGSFSDLPIYQVRLTFQGNDPWQPDYLDFNKIRDNGPDIRFTDTDTGTPIPYWIESWDDTLKTAVIWVDVPNIPIAGKTIYIYYGNPTITSQSGVNFQLYDLPFSNRGYWHMDELAWNGTPGEVLDETGLNNGTAQNGATTTPLGYLNGAGAFDGTNDYLEVPHSTSLNITNAITIDTWFYLNQLKTTNPILRKDSSHFADVNEDGVVNTPDATLISAHFGTNPGSPNWCQRCDLNEDNQITVADGVEFSISFGATKPLWFIQIQSNNYSKSDPQKILFSLGESLRLFSSKTFTAIDEGQWWHILATYDGSTMSIYINDVLDNSTVATGNISPTSESLRMANDPSDRINTNYLNGYLDEVQISGKGPAPSFLSLGAEETRPLVDFSPFSQSQTTPETIPEEKPPIQGKTIEEMKREDIVREISNILIQLSQLYSQLTQILRR